MVAHLTGGEVAAGSNPVSPTIKIARMDHAGFFFLFFRRNSAAKQNASLCEIRRSRRYRTMKCTHSSDSTISAASRATSGIFFRRK